ncbi:isoprenoid synthase domain-containing protein [Irpex lacteus]|nr:isoprenoid synthase domain-containing protein [Irpex lacteus]
MIEIVIDAIKNPSKPRPEGEIILGEIARQFWARGEKTATPEAAKHFVEAFTDYLNSVIVQASDRDNDKIRTVDEYFQTRRENIGARPSYVPGELHLSIPDYAFYHPVMKELEYLIADLIIWITYDIASYNKEQATGDDRHNILTIVMHQFNLSLPDAMKWVVKYHEERVPSWGKEIDDQVAVYIEHLAGWPRCNDCWNFESGRYLKTRLVPLLPKRKLATHLHKENVEVPIVDAL